MEQQQLQFNTVSEAAPEAQQTPAEIPANDIVQIPPAEPKKERRGRPRKDSGTGKQIKFEEPKKVKDSADELDNVLKGYDKQAPADENTAQSPDIPLQIKSHINGAMFVAMIDLILPAALLFIAKQFDLVSDKVMADDIRLSKKQMDNIEPIAEEVAKEVFANMSPVSALLLSLATAYMGNIIEVGSKKK
jgi:hypothetical protein